MLTTPLRQQEKPQSDVTISGGGTFSKASSFAESVHWSRRLDHFSRERSRVVARHLFRVILALHKLKTHVNMIHESLFLAIEQIRDDASIGTRGLPF